MSLNRFDLESWTLRGRLIPATSRMRNGTFCCRISHICETMHRSVSIPNENCSTPFDTCRKQAATGDSCRTIFRPIPPYINSGDAGSPQGYSKTSLAISAFSLDFWRTKKLSLRLPSWTLAPCNRRRKAVQGQDLTGTRKRRDRKFISLSIRWGISWMCL